MEDKTKILERIRKLLALSRSPNENEAMLAAQKTQELLAEHNLSMSEAEEADASEKEDILTDKAFTKARPWRRPIAGGVAPLYFCKYYYHSELRPLASTGRYVRHDVHNFVGASHNVEVVKMMFEYLTDTVERLARAGALKLPKKQRNKYRNSFRASCASRLRERLNARLAELVSGTAKSSTGKNLPALRSLYEQALEAIQPHLPKDLRMKKVRMTASHSLGAEHGRTAADQIGLDSQITGTKAASTMIGSSLLERIAAAKWKAVKPEAVPNLHPMIDVGKVPSKKDAKIMLDVSKDPGPDGRYYIVHLEELPRHDYNILAAWECRL